MVFWEFKIRGHGDFSTFDDGIDGTTFLFFMDVHVLCYTQILLIVRH